MYCVESMKMYDVVKIQKEREIANLLWDHVTLRNIHWNRLAAAAKRAVRQRIRERWEKQWERGDNLRTYEALGTGAEQEDTSVV